MDPRSNPALTAECTRALVAGARGAGTRQQVRAAARRFVRRHRHEHGYLRWVLRSVGARSALAVALLGLSAAPATAELAPFRMVPPSTLDFDAGQTRRPALGDLDGDGDLDLVTGEVGGGFDYYQNTGHATTLGVRFPLSSASPLANQDVGSFSAPALGDLNGDGDLDLIVGRGRRDLPLLRQRRQPDDPVLHRLPGAENPFAGHDVGVPTRRPALGDLDGDGDLDLVAGEQA